MRCEGCGGEMENLGNRSGYVYESMPPQWNDVYICRKCKIKMNIRVRGVDKTDQTDLSDYTQIGDSVPP